MMMKIKRSLYISTNIIISSKSLFKVRLFKYLQLISTFLHSFQTKFPRVHILSRVVDIYSSYLGAFVTCPPLRLRLFLIFLF